MNKAQGGASSTGLVREEASGKVMIRLGFTRKEAIMTRIQGSYRKREECTVNTRGNYKLLWYLGSFILL